MKNLLVITVLLIVVSCQKQARETLRQTPPTDVVLENKSKDEEVVRRRANERRYPPKGKPPKDVTDPQPPQETSAGCLLLDFDGQNVSGTLWNTSGDILCEPAGLTATQQNDVLNRVIFDYSFNPGIKVTADEAVFNSYPQNKRRRCIITTTNFYGNVGGVSYLNSFNWFDDSPCFVFSGLLGLNTKYVSDATSHECGHTLGCRHQSEWQYNADGSCTKISDYLWGDLIMGASYNAPVPRFGIGPNSLGCQVIQNDTLTINNALRQ